MPPKKLVKKSSANARPSASKVKVTAPKAFSKGKRTAKIAKARQKPKAQLHYTSKYRYVQAKTFARPRSSKSHKVVVKEYVSAASNSGDTVTIYVLALMNGKFYVGKTSRPNVEERLYEHQQGNGTAWTKLHRPLHVVEIHRNADPFDEDKITKKWMLKHGIANVHNSATVVDGKAMTLNRATQSPTRTARTGASAVVERDTKSPRVTQSLMSSWARLSSLRASRLRRKTRGKRRTAKTKQLATEPTSETSASAVDLEGMPWSHATRRAMGKDLTGAFDAVGKVTPRLRAMRRATFQALRLMQEGQPLTP